MMMMRPPEPLEDKEEEEGEKIRRCVIHVPTKKVGYLIGKSGRTIFGFEKQTGAKIDIMAPNSREFETPVALSGQPKAVSQVIRLIMDLYCCNNYSSQLWKEENPSDLNENNRRPKLLASERIMIFAPFVTFLIQNEGKIAEAIENFSGAKLFIHQDEEDLGQAPVDVCGSADQIRMALKLLRERISEYEMVWAGQMNKSNTFSHGLPTVRKKLWTVDGAKRKPLSPKEPHLVREKLSKCESPWKENHLYTQPPPFVLSNNIIQQ